MYIDNGNMLFKTERKLRKKEYKLKISTLSQNN